MNDWSKATPEEVLKDVESLSATILEQRALAEDWYVPPIVAETLIKVTIKEPYERARRLFNLKHA
jgi:hypothetical protein